MAAAPVLERRFTADDLLDMEDGEHYELVDGCLLELNVSAESSRVQMRIATVIGPLIYERDLGELYGSEAGFRLDPSDPDHTRRPDVAFISRERAPVGDPAYVQIAPELVIEVVSLNDGAKAVRDKAQEWLSNGVRVVWVVYPASREVYVYRTRTVAQVFADDMEISAEDILPGFSAPVSRFFARSGVPAAPRA